MFKEKKSIYKAKKKNKSAEIVLFLIKTD